MPNQDCIADDPIIRFFDCSNTWLLDEMCDRWNYLDEERSDGGYLFSLCQRRFVGKQLVVFYSEFAVPLKTLFPHDPKNSSSSLLMHCHSNF